MVCYFPLRLSLHKRDARVPTPCPANNGAVLWRISEDKGTFPLSPPVLFSHVKIKHGEVSEA